LSFLVLAFVFIRIKKRPEQTLNFGILLLLFSITFFWFSISQSGISDTIYGTVTRILSRFTADFVSPTARPNIIFASHPIQTFVSSFNWILFYVVHFFVVIGIFAVMLNKQDGKLDFIYRIMILLCSTLLFLTIAVPNLSATLNFDRFYAITFLFLAPCLVIGGKTLFLIFKKVLIRIMRSHNVKLKKVNAIMMLIGLIMSAYFLSQYGFFNRYAGGSPQSYTLDWDRLKTSTDPQIAMDFYFFFTPEQDAASASWLSKFMANSSIIYSDFVSMYHPLKVLGFIPEANLMLLPNLNATESNSYFYLRYYNVITGYFIAYPNWVLNTTELAPYLNYRNIVYTNGESIVYASQSK
jgi:uncharacterized membrane protein